MRQPLLTPMRIAGRGKSQTDSTLRKHAHQIAVEEARSTVPARGLFIITVAGGVRVCPTWLQESAYAVESLVLDQRERRSGVRHVDALVRPTGAPGTYLHA